MAPTTTGTDRISDLPDEIIRHILSFLPSSQIALTSLLSKRWNPLWLTIPNADRISALPIEILCCILSRLPTKQIFVTSLLSRRWRPLRKRILDVKLDDTEDDHDQDAYNRYLRMVYSFIFERQLRIKTLTLLSASRFCNTTVLLRLLCPVSYGFIDHLDLTFLQHSSTGPIYLPRPILTYSPLVVLNLNGNGVLTIHHVHKYLTHLPELKKLHMTKVRFRKLKYLIKILSVCPLLEDLLIKNVSTHDDNDTLDALAKQTDELLEPFPNLLKAHISDSSSISSFFPLKLFYNVEFLRAQVAVRTPLNLFYYVAPVQTTQFFNLTHVELSFEKEDEEYYYYYRWDWLKKFIHACPSLQSIVIHKIGGGGGGGGGYGLSVDDHNSLHPQFVPNCNAFDHCNKSSFLEILEARKVSFAEINNSK